MCVVFIFFSVVFFLFSLISFVVFDNEQECQSNEAIYAEAETTLEVTF